MSKMVRLTDEVYQRIEELKSSGTSMSSFIEELLSQGTPAGEVSTSGDSVQLEYISQQVDAILAKLDTPSEKKSLNPAGSGMKQVRSKHVVNAELFAVRGQLRNIVTHVQDRAREEEWTDEEALSYAHKTETDLKEQEQALLDELSKLGE